MNPIEAAYYEGWYMVKNVIKYTNLKIFWGGVQDEVIYIASLDILEFSEQHEEQLEAA